MTTNSHYERYLDGLASMNRKHLPVALLKRYFGNPFNGLNPQAAAIVSRMKANGYHITRNQLHTWTGK